VNTIERPILMGRTTEPTGDRCNVHDPRDRSGRVCGHPLQRITDDQRRTEREADAFCPIHGYTN
jgi:hypothetical protein